MDDLAWVFYGIGSGRSRCSVDDPYDFEQDARIFDMQGFEMKLVALQRVALQLVLTALGSDAHRFSYSVQSRIYRIRVIKIIAGPVHSLLQRFFSLFTHLTACALRSIAKRGTAA